MVSLCCHAPTDYQYGVWHACRACGMWTSMMPEPLLAGHTFVIVEHLPHTWPSRGHASAPMKRDRSGGDEPEAIL